VDFVFGTEDAASAAALGVSLGRRPQLLQIADMPSVHFDGVSVARDEVRGSVRVKDKDFDGWLAAVYARLSVGGSDEETVAWAGDGR
jgi:hypothetical protein